MKRIAIRGALAASALLTMPPAAARQNGPAIVTTPVEHSAVVTRHRGVFNGQRIAYTATIEPLVVASGASQAKVVSFAYTRDGTNPRTRPVLFLFNGGPIVPSLYVHLGGLGPKRVAFPDDVAANPASFRLIDNPDSPLDAMDLVFVDPASTGFSRVMPGTDPHAYFSVPADAAQVAAFIRAWLKAKGRDGAPVYLFGESYGTNRAATIAGQLSEGHDRLPLAGVFLLGQAVNILEYAQRPNNVVSYVASLPTLATIAYYHDRAEKKGRSLADFLADARMFAKGEYLTALYAGDAIADPQRREVAARLQAFTGIPADWYATHRLRITKEAFRLALLKDRGLLLGRADARYVAPVTDKGGALDPSSVVTDTIERLFGDYLKTDLKVDWRDPYVMSVPLPSLDDWNWGFGSSPFGDWAYAAGLTKAMTLNPRFRLVIGNGMYDTQTTMGAAELLATQYGWDPSRVALHYYVGGHVSYSVAASAKAIGDDIRAMAR